MQNTPELARLSEVARRLGIPRPSIAYWCYRGAIRPANRYPKPVYDVEEVRSFMARYYIPRRPLDVH